jgi:hypothetical protein
MTVIMAAALLGSLINIPVARRPAKVRQITAPVTVSGVTYRVPLAVQTGRTLAGGFAAMMTQTAMTFWFGTAADARVPNLGASGAIAATLRAYFVLYPGSRKKAGHRPPTQPGSPPQPGRHVRDPTLALSLTTVPSKLDGQRRSVAPFLPAPQLAPEP